MLIGPAHNDWKIKCRLYERLHQKPGSPGRKLQGFFHGRDQMVVSMELICAGFTDHSMVFLQTYCENNASQKALIML